MTTTKVTRRDPMTTVMDYELLRVAHGLLEAKQNPHYWAARPTPLRPLGQVKFERTRQVATFALPLLVLLFAWFGFGLRGVLFALPVAFALGYFLDRHLMACIEIKERRDNETDAGRYRAVKFLSEQMGMTPAEITLPVIYKMAEDYRKVDQQVKVAEAKALAREQAATAAADAEFARRRAARSSRYGATGGAAVAGFTGAAVATGAEYDYSVPDATSFTPVVNPVNGLPMIEGTFLDVAGNPFGSDGQ